MMAHEARLQKIATKAPTGALWLALAEPADSPELAELAR